VKKVTEKDSSGAYWNKLREIYVERFKYLSSHDSDVRHKTYIMCIQGHSDVRISQFYLKIRKTLSKAGF
jgi:hypothetical protein